MKLLRRCLHLLLTAVLQCVYCMPDQLLIFDSNTCAGWVKRSICRAKQIVQSLMDSTSAYCVHAVALPAQATGGTKTSTLAQLFCYRHTGVQC